MGGPKAIENHDCRSLSQILGGVTLASSQALHYALLAAEALREIHDAGQTHGAISVHAITVAGPTVKLLPARSSDQPHDARSDIFAFGSVLAQLLTGAAEADRLVRKCVSPDPAARCQRIQQVIIELKLLIVKDRLRRMQSAADRLESIGACLAGIVSRLDERRHGERPETFWFPGRSGRGWHAIGARGASTVQNEYQPALNPANQVYE